MRGRNNTIIHFVSAYNCYFGECLLMIYNQQRRFLDKKDNNRSLQQAFIEDLFTNTQAWVNNRERIILAVDLNDNVTDY